ncbi:MAG TPA: 2OG-Fe(II) oxygenase, partial [Amycolatopsis sp.]|nr:2OG-Fe(II) oxygenase [Amycolatopsis sp.]
MKLSERISRLDWPRLLAEVDEHGCALTSRLLDAQECHDLSALYDDQRRFRATIDMVRYRFGSGEYRYFAYPLPEAVRQMREAFYPHLLPIARDWA